MLLVSINRTLLDELDRKILEAVLASLAVTAPAEARPQLHFAVNELKTQGTIPHDVLERVYPQLTG